VVNPDAYGNIHPNDATILDDVGTGKKPLSMIPEGNRMQALRLISGKYGTITNVDQGNETYKSEAARQNGVDGIMVTNTRTGASEFRPGTTLTQKTPSSAAVISDETATRVAKQVVDAGDYSGTTGMSRSAQSMSKLQDAITRESTAKWGADKAPSMLATMKAEFAGRMRAEAALGTRAGQLGLAAESAAVLIPQALQWSEKVDRSRFPDINKIWLAAKEKTGDENVIRFGIAVQGLMNTYAQVLSRAGGVTTDAARESAERKLQTAWSKGQFRQAVEGINQEIQAELKAPEMARMHLRDAWNDKPPADAYKTPVARSKEDYDSLQPGTKFIWVYPDGRTKEGFK
jgi:hypothetical protein